MWGLGPLHCWTGTEELNRSVFYAPAPIVAYNTFMNSVDILDQQRSTNAAERNEKRLSMSIFTLILDLAIHNAFALHSWLLDNKNNVDENPQPLAYREFKRRIAEQLVNQYCSHTSTNYAHPFNDTQSKPCQDIVEESHNNCLVNPVDINPRIQESNQAPTHILLPTKNKQRLQCYLCKIVDSNKQRKSGFCCTECGVGFHVECFAAFHHTEEMQEHKPALHCLIVGSHQTYHQQFKKPKNIASLTDLQLPCV